MELTLFLLQFPLFMMAVVVHEFAHGWVALRLGDPTAHLAGRLTLNPVRHIDPIGTVLLPVLLILIRSPFILGWAKPVPVNPENLRAPRNDMLWVGIAGPTANFLLALGLAGLLHLSRAFLPLPLYTLGSYLVIINLLLGLFNLLPIPPLDGSRVLAGLLPVPWARRVLGLERWGILIVVGLFYLGFMERILWPAVLRLVKGLGL